MILIVPGWRIERLGQVEHQRNKYIMDLEDIEGTDLEDVDGS